MCPITCKRWLRVEVECSGKGRYDNIEYHLYPLAKELDARDEWAEWVVSLYEKKHEDDEGFKCVHYRWVELPPYVWLKDEANKVADELKEKQMYLHVIGGMARRAKEQMEKGGSIVIRN